jgi:hypothetical protein
MDSTFEIGAPLIPVIVPPARGKNEPPPPPELLTVIVLPKVVTVVSPVPTIVIGPINEFNDVTPPPVPELLQHPPIALPFFTDVT